jgi:hypothetical protein
MALSYHFSERVHAPAQNSGTGAPALFAHAFSEVKPSWHPALTEISLLDALDVERGFALRRNRTQAGALLFACGHGLACFQRNHTHG